MTRISTLIFGAALGSAERLTQTPPQLLALGSGGPALAAGRRTRLPPLFRRKGRSRSAGRA